MLKALVRKQCMQMLSALYIDRRKGGRRSPVTVFLYLGLFVYCFAMFAVMFYGIASAICTPLLENGAGWLYFALMGIAATAIGVFGSVFTAYSALYAAKDNDLLLSMPIPPGKILLVRMLGCYATAFLFEALVMAPASVVYFMNSAPGAVPVIMCALNALVLPLGALVISCILGWVIALVSPLFKNRSFVSVALSLIFIAVYFFLYSKMNSVISLVLANAGAVGEKVRTFVWPLYCMGRGAQGDVLLGSVFVGISAAVFGAVYFVMSKSFIKLVTTQKGGTGAAYRGKKQRASSVDAALLKKELLHLKSSAVYMLNCALGTLLLPVASIVILVKKNWIMGLLGGAPEFLTENLPVLGCAAVCLAASMNDLTAPSVSLEGKSLWISRSLPVRPWKILKAKINMHLLLTLAPVFVAAVCAAAALGVSPAEGVLMAAVSGAYVLFVAAMGLCINLLMPNLDWVSETAAVKQNIGVLLALFGNWAVILLLGGLFALLQEYISSGWFLAIASAVLVIAAGGLILWIRKKGT
ncbi:MAG: hypothetical protein ACI4XQ_05430, partial [Eubacteriales bacterium]